MAKALTVTKSGNNAVTVKFGGNLPALAKLKAGEEVPAEYLHSILNFHVTNQSPQGKVHPRQINRMKAYW